MFFSRINRFLCLFLILVLFASGHLRAQTEVTQNSSTSPLHPSSLNVSCYHPAVILSPTTSPGAGQPGIQTITITGYNFPAETLAPDNITIHLDPVTPGSGISVTTSASALTTIIGSTKRIAFQIPSSLTISTPTPYLILLSGNTSAGTSFSSSNKVNLTINPPSVVYSLTPVSSKAGEAISISITARFTNFVQGATMAHFGPGISVGGAAEGEFGLITVTGPTAATAQIKVSPSASTGLRKIIVKTGVQQTSLENTFSVMPSQPENLPPVFSPISNQSLDEGSSLSFDIFASDPEGDSGKRES